MLLAMKDLSCSCKTWPNLCSQDYSSSSLYWQKSGYLAMASRHYQYFKCFLSPWQFTHLHPPPALPVQSYFHSYTLMAYNRCVKFLHVTDAIIMLFAGGRMQELGRSDNAVDHSRIINDHSCRSLWWIYDWWMWRQRTYIHQYTRYKNKDDR